MLIYFLATMLSFSSVKEASRNHVKNDLYYEAKMTKKELRKLKRKK